ncbi:hypothetical protein KCG48_01310 [Proteiniclasticum sp. BAD-10]|uniref:Uncharacterized protein n=1 Tax=Proteiniclasticum sediminis TaxID=2804028 RepID=A0A941CNW7_9CLOT|nr:hypothetical protein [Proteiniclasticum sediminis]MBR0574969.1 hypothetical protein [Proteiniclasticum sediminis]
MKQEKIRNILQKAVEERSLCRVYLGYNVYYQYYFPVLVGEKLFLGAEEDDFILNGFSILRFQDVEKVELKDDLCIKILEQEGIIESLQVPSVDLSSWREVFRSLEKMNRNIIVEKESLKKRETEFYIGRILKMGKNHVELLHFDAMGNWLDQPYRISFEEITSVKFGTRYVETFSKYLEDIPASMKKRIQVHEEVMG